MSEQQNASGTGEPSTGGTGGDGQQNTSTDQQQGNTSQQRGTNDGAGQQGQERIEDLPPWAQRLIATTRREAAGARTSAKATAADEARNEILQKLGRALGFTQDETPDPERLAKDLQERDGKLREATVQLAVLRAAGRAGGDPDALLDSRSFLASLHGLDPAAEGFAGQVEAAIAQAVRDNPRLGIGTPVTKSGGEISGGSSEAPARDGELSWEDAEKLAKRSRKPYQR